jgi:hypothetical protein
MVGAPRRVDDEMTTATKVVTTFSKAYVIERIEARQATLDLKIAEAKTHVAEVTALYDSKVEEVFRANLDAISVGLDKGKKLAKKFDSATDPVERREIADSLRKAIQLTEIPSAKGYVQRHHPGEYAGMTERDRVAAEISDSAEWRRESIALTHVLAYLREVPLEEFTLTALGKLGLVDAIKFTLPKVGA